MVDMELISEKLQAGRAKEVTALVQQALDEGVGARRILEEALMPGMAAVGVKFKNGEAFVPEVLVAARAMNRGAALLKPHLAGDGSRATGRVCLGTVQGDYHDVGKNLVKMMLESKGLEVVDLGTDVPPDAFVMAAQEQDCRIICCSALLTTTMEVMRDVVKAVDAAGMRGSVKVMIGGAPVTEAFCREIGADFYTPDAARCADLAADICRGDA
jgi:methanogenic corrinoid protein MtbC1